MCVFVVDFVGAGTVATGRGVGVFRGGEERVGVMAWPPTVVECERQVHASTPRERGTVMCVSSKHVCCWKMSKCIGARQVVCQM